MSEIDIPEDFVILEAETAPDLEPRIIEIQSQTTEKTTSLRWNDEIGATHVIRLDQVVEIAIEPAESGYWLVARFIGVSKTVILNYANPEQDQEQAVSTAIQILKMSHNALYQY